MTDPTFAQNVPGKGRHYVHPQTGEIWPSVTNVLNTSVSKPALVPAAVKTTAEAAVSQVPLLIASMTKARCKPKRVADECTECFDCLVKRIKRKHRDDWDRAADLGTRVHDWAEAKVLGMDMTDLDPWGDIAPFGKQLLRFFHEHGVDMDKDIVASEATVVNRKVGYAGTGDLWVRLRTGAARKRLVLIDYKSSSTRAADSVYPEMGMQLAALANGETILVDDGTEIDAPKGIRAAYILNLRADDYALIPMPIDGDLPAAFEGFKGALANANYLHSQYGKKPSLAIPSQVKAVA